MAYFKLIETSQTWICPKTAEYKIVCIAGGEGSGDSREIIPGSPTSFGSYLTASGAIPACVPNNSSGIIKAGMNGYVLSDPSMYGTYSSEGHAVGYGAGNCKTGSTNSCGGKAGKLLMTVVSLTEGQSVYCTVGAGGSSSGAAAGADGAVMIQEV